MGRYYSGQISGKFWFGIQSSDDASNFGVKHRTLFSYFLCNCGCENKSISYCNDCYGSYEEHRQAIIDDEENDLEFNKRRKNLWRKDESEIYYTFKKRHIKKVEQIVKDLDKEVGQYIIGYNIKDENDEIEYDYENIDDTIDKDKMELLARFCLGRQILYCLKKHYTCTFYAEL